MSDEELSIKLQQILDEQGYVVLGVRRRHEIGDVLDYFHFVGKAKDIKTVVIGFATLEEWERQNLRAFGSFSLTEELAQVVKVIAE